MPSRKPYARIAVTLPAADLATADRVAKEQDRSRSWVVAEAVRQYTSTRHSGPGRASFPAEPHAGALGLGVSRRAQLIADLRLTPEQRVRAAEETARAAPRARRAAVRRIIMFERYEDYLDWKRVEDAIG